MSKSDTASRLLRVREVDDDVHAADTVRHIDELSDDTLQRFYEAIDSRAPIAGLDDPELEDGTVVVFTDYYRVERV
ncbi:hypothetical protein [Natrinema salifodinae]|uniref:DUF7979 domain-containing protein n=1 Tax=Natrinema salifodinae TaxID=1202768 RepID=A0A1I0PJ06_9EURY|nr:hypothetical protein [Natrinema salifodinae]SEW13756.1 hypothetical protein SAMN05216285_2570 [Natrinema salifodinae]